MEYNHITSFVQASLPWLHLDDRWTKDNSNPDSIFGATQPTSLRLSLGTGNAEMLGVFVRSMSPGGSAVAVVGLAFFLDFVAILL